MSVAGHVAGGPASVPHGVPILVLKQRREIFNHTGLAIGRRGAALGIEVIRLQEDRFAPSALSRFGRGLPMLDEGASSRQWLDYLCEIGRRLGPAVLVPIDDVSAVFLDDHGPQLEQSFLFPRRDPAISRRLADKSQMHALCVELGIPAPECELPREEADVVAYARGGDFPVVVKQIDAWHAPREAGAPTVVIARSAEELLTAYRRIESPEAPNVMLQEYIPGGSDSIWMFNGYFDASSECRFGCAGRKLRQRGPRTGPTTLGECLPSPPVEEATKRLARAVGYRGIIDIGYRFDQRDGAYKLLDVNPRIGGSFRLFVGEDGMDVVQALYLDLTGQRIPRSRPRYGRRWLVEPYDMVAAAQLNRAGELGVWAWATSFRGVQEAAWLAWRDPLPFVGMGLRMLLSVPARLGARRRRSSSGGA